ncbi:MAG: DUF4336 domain-containing protein [Gammaproteobacteria bacterium]|nr:DUF4336 domain-containing protein [Gammaproteobacteria bacterium]
MLLQEFAPSLYTVDGPTVSFYGFPYPTRMAVVVLGNGDLWVWSPVALNEELVDEVQSLGPVRHIVSPNKIHHIFLSQWAQQWPDARLYSPPGLSRRKPALKFDAELVDEPDPAWEADIDQVIFHGSVAMEEVVFFHRSSSTAIFCDLIQRHPESQMTGLKGMLMKLDGLVGNNGSTPREWRLSFLNRSRARMAREKVMQWQAQRLLIAHGKCEQSNASETIRSALAWM